MKRVEELIGRGDYGQALVRLWVLAGQAVTGGSRLNAWERTRDAQAFPGQVETFLQELQSEAHIDAERMERAPLAFIAALDKAYALLRALLYRSTSWNQPFEEEGGRYWLTRIELSHRSSVPFARQAGNREAWFKWHSVVPVRTSHGIDIAVSPATGRLAQFLSERAEDDTIELLVWIGHLDDDARLTWDSSPSRKFRLRSVEPAAVRQESIRQTLEQAAKAGADIVVMPEFTVDMEGRRFVAHWLLENEHPFKIVVAGSFHENTPDGWFNTAEVWDRIAQPILKHRKMRLFGQAEGLAEDVGEGHCLTLLTTPIGTLSLLICKDFMDAHQSVATLLQEAPIDWALVPSYGDDSTWRAHKERAIALAGVGPGISSIVSNQRNIEITNGSPLPGFSVQAVQATVCQVDSAGGLICMIAKKIWTNRAY